MKKIVCFAVACVLMSHIAIAEEKTSEVSIIPRPLEMTVHEGTFHLTPETKIVSEKDLATPLIEGLRTTGYDFERVDSGKSNAISLKLAPRLSNTLGDEGYRLSVTKDAIDIRAATRAGVFYGIQSLRQLLSPEIFNKATVAQESWAIPCVEIVDRPRFKWRGLMLDPARASDLPFSFFYKYVDLLALHKFNRLQLHLTDDSYWKMEIKKYPNLTEHQSGKVFYSQDELRDLVAYAAQRHIIVVPEIETPGHAGAAVRAYPAWGTQGTLNLDAETISAFQDIFKEVMAVFPSPYIHVGGDEVRPVWLWTEEGRKYLEERGFKGKNKFEIQEWLQNQLIQPILENPKTRPLLWQVNPHWNVEESTISKDCTILGWFDRKTSMRAVSAGYDVVMAPMDGTYFDYRIQRDSPISGIGINTLDNVYNYDPLPAELMNPTTSKRILGVQGQVWVHGDMASPEGIDKKSFPRTCALAEVAWTTPPRKDYQTFLQRMKTHYKRLDALEVEYYKLKKPMTLVAADTITAAKDEKQPFQWDITEHITAAGTYEIMFHVIAWNQGLEAGDLRLFRNGKVIVSSDWTGNTNHRGGKINGLTQLKLAEYDPRAKYRLKVNLKSLRGHCDFEFCIRKKPE